jgi:hypothetical protein
LSFGDMTVSEEVDMPELTRRYIVMAMATEGPFDVKDPEVPFVLKPWKDPSALAALRAYRDACYPELAAELTAWIDQIAAGAPVLGGVGRRNADYQSARAKASVRRVSKVKSKPRRRSSRAKMKVAERKASKKRKK